MKFITNIAAAICISGCAASGIQVSQEAAMQFKENVATESEIVAKLGRPTSTMIMSGMRMIVYSGMQYRTKPESFIPIVGLVAGGADYAYSSAVFQIGEDGILKKITYTSSGSGVRQGVTPATMPSTEPTAVQ